MAETTNPRERLKQACTFWLEGELSVLSAVTGVGKNLLAVQIAEFHALDRDRQRIFPQQHDVLGILQSRQIGFLEIRSR